jgi:hypothetical protein
MPGGWNRIQIEVDDLVSTVASLKSGGNRFRNDIVVGNGGKQILVEEPPGNPIEFIENVKSSTPPNDAIKERPGISSLCMRWYCSFF